MRRIHFAVVSLAASVAATLAACGSSTSGNNGSGGSQDQDSGATTTPVQDASVNTSDSGGNGDSSAPTGGYDAGPVSTTYPAPHAAWPPIIDRGGPVLTAPNVLTVTFNSDTNATQLAAFGLQATSTTNAYWNTVRAGYCETGSTTACVGNGTGTSAALTETLATSYADNTDPTQTSTLKTFIQSLITAGKITPTANTLAVFYFPSTTTITLASGPGTPASSCQQFGGYHGSMTDTEGVQFAYAIVPECPAAQGQTLSVLQETTFAASHEIIEAATDPFLTETTSGFYMNTNDFETYPWLALSDGEVADMCVDQLGFNQDQYVEDGFTVQRIFSLAAAAAGGDPCVPAQPATKPYFNVAAEEWLQTETVGGTATFYADAFSNMAVPGGWSVIGYDTNATSASNISPYVSISLDDAAANTPTTINNGQRLKVSVTLNQDPASLSQTVGGALALLISFNGGTSIATATAGNLWPFLVQSVADAEDGGEYGEGGVLEIDAATGAATNLPLHHLRIKPVHLTPGQIADVLKNLRATH